MSDYFEVNARTTLMRNRLWKEKENDRKRTLKSSQTMRRRMNQTLRRISTKDSRDPLTIATWDLNEERRNRRMRMSLTRQTT